MHNKLTSLTYEIDLQQGEKLIFPNSIAEKIGAGRWLITIEPVPENAAEPTRNHNAFLNSYVAEDEELYDDYSTR